MDKFSEKFQVVETVRTQKLAARSSKTWGPALVFRKLWEEQGLPESSESLAESIAFPDSSAGDFNPQAGVLAEQGIPFFVDAGSSNGTFVNGQGVSKAWVKPGDVITLGSTQIRIRT